MFLWVKVVYYDMKSQMQSKAINKGKAIPTRYNNLDFSFLYKPGYKSKYTFLHSLFHTRREGILDCKSYSYPKLNNHIILFIRAKKMVTSIEFWLPCSNLVVSIFSTEGVILFIIIGDEDISVYCPLSVILSHKIPAFIRFWIIFFA